MAMTPVFINSRKFDALQRIMDDRQDSIDRVTLLQALVFEARINCKACPLYENDCGEYYTSVEELIPAMQNYINITADEVRNA